MTWFFEGLQQATVGAGAAVGWTETWALRQASADIDQCFTNPDVLNYTNLRANCLSNQYRISFLRASEVKVPGTTAARRVKVASLAAVNGALITAVNGGAQVQCAILVDLMKLPVGGPLDKVHHRKFLLRGLSQDVISGNIINTGGANWNAYKTFFDFIGNKVTTGVHGAGPRATQLGISYQDQVAFPKVPLPAVQILANGQQTIDLLTTLLPGIVGDQWRISGIPGVQGSFLNRIWTFISQAAGPPAVATFGRSRVGLPITAIPFPNLGTLQRVGLQVGPLDQYAIIGLRSKRTGRVFHQLRGRSSNRVRR